MPCIILHVLSCPASLVVCANARPVVPSNAVTPVEVRIIPPRRSLSVVGVDEMVPLRRMENT